MTCSILSCIFKKSFATETVISFMGFTIIHRNGLVWWSTDYGPSIPDFEACLSWDLVFMITPLSLWCLLDGKMLWVWNSLLVFCDEFVKTSSSIPIFSEMKSRCKLSWDNVIPLIGIQHHQQSTGPPVTACLFWWTHVDGYLFWILTVAMISAFLHYKVFSKWIRERLLYWDTLFQ